MLIVLSKQATKT